MQNRTLTMKFDTDEGSIATLSVPYCKEDISEQEAKSLMDAIIAGDIFVRTLTAKRSAQIIERSTTDLF